MQGELRSYFEAEARELIDRLARGAALLGRKSEEGHDEAAAMADMARAAHTLKGAAHVVGERAMATQSHDFEDALAAYKQAPSPAAAAAVLALADALAAALAGEPAPAPATPKPVTTAAIQVPAASGLPREATPLRAAHTVRVDVTETRKLLEGVAESGTLLGTLRLILSRSAALDGTGTSAMRRVERDALRVTLRDTIDRLARQMENIHQVASGLRLGTSETLLREAARAVRATASSLGKAVTCVVHGDSERVELPILDAMADALLHLVRNAVAHGVESPAERKAAGKPATATVRIDVKREGTDVVFTCADDGRGLALDSIRRAAVSRGTMTEAQARDATRDSLQALLLLPGFSLGSTVDEVSGRGVGLDAVREAAASVRGTVTIESTEGAGTSFSIRVPQTVFALPTLDVKAGGRRFALPVAAVEQTFRMEAHLTTEAERTHTLRLGRETMPYVRLSDAFPPQPSARASDHHDTMQTCVVFTAGAQRLALAVDRLEDFRESLVQPVLTFAGIESYVAGTTLAADGEPYFVLDAAEFLAAHTGGFFQAHTVVLPGIARKPILVIDDSLTTRMLEQSILEAEGYEVEVATSAEQGLAMARVKEYALFLVDVEMPGMNGFEFVALVTADAQLKAIPAILVTSLDSAENRERGRAAGAYSYIVKGEFNQQIYLDRIRSVVGSGA